MIEVTLLGLAYLAGVNPWRLALLGLAVTAPLVVIPVIVFVSRRSRATDGDGAPLFCESVSSELRSGASLAAALESAAASLGIESGDLAASGPDSVRAVAETAARQFGDIGVELRATIEAAARVGGSAADLFDELGAVAIAHAEIEREIRLASAPARATAWFFLIAPTAFISIQARSGGLDPLLHTTEQRLAAAIGLLLFLLGLGGVIALLWSAR